MRCVNRCEMCVWGGFGRCDAAAAGDRGGARAELDGAFDAKTRSGPAEPAFKFGPGTLRCAELRCGTRQARAHRQAGYSTHLLTRQAHIFERARQLEATARDAPRTRASAPSTPIEAGAGGNRDASFRRRLFCALGGDTRTTEKDKYLQSVAHFSGAGCATRLPYKRGVDLNT